MFLWKVLILLLVTQLRGSQAQCGGFLRRPARTSRNDTAAMFLRFAPDNVAHESTSNRNGETQANDVPVTDLVQCWWNFRHVTDEMRFRYKVTWRHIVVGAGARSGGGFAVGTQWRILVEYDSEIASIDRIRNAELNLTTNSIPGTDFMFEGLFNGHVDGDSHPLIHFSYHMEFSVGAHTPAPLRFTLFLQESDAGELTSFEPVLQNDNASNDVATTPQSSEKTNSGSDGDVVEDDNAGIGFEEQARANSTTEPPTVQVTTYDVPKRRRTEVWVMAMCVIVGLSVGLMLMATCVHPMRCIAFWRKRRIASSSTAYNSESPTAMATTEIHLDDKSVSAAHTGADCNCKAGRYTRTSALEAEFRQLEALRPASRSGRDLSASELPPIPVHVLHARFSMPEFAACRESVSTPPETGMCRTYQPYRYVPLTNHLLLAGSGDSASQRLPVPGRNSPISTGQNVRLLGHRDFSGRDKQEPSTITAMVADRSSPSVPLPPLEHSSSAEPFIITVSADGSRQRRSLLVAPSVHGACSQDGLESAL